MPPHQRKTLAEPNVSDPLSEPTPGRRIWASYLRAKYNRRTFAKLLGMSYQGLYQWDTGKTTPDLHLLIKAAGLLGLTMDDVCFGHHKPVGAQRREPLLSHEAVRALLYEMTASAEQAAALGEFLASPSGQYVSLTRSWVEAFVVAYAQAISEQLSAPDAINVAKRVAANTQATVDTQALRVTPPTPERMAEIARAIHAVTTPDPRGKRRRA